MKSFPGEGITVVIVEPLSEVIRKSGRGGKDLETMLYLQGSCWGWQIGYLPWITICLFAPGICEPLRETSLIVMWIHDFEMYSHIIWALQAIQQKKETGTV